MKTILFRTSLVGMLAASAFYAQGLGSLDRNTPSASNGGHQKPARYSVTDLGTLGRTFRIACGINNPRRVGGRSVFINGNVDALRIRLRGQSMTSNTCCIELRTMRCITRGRWRI